MSSIRLIDIVIIVMLGFLLMGTAMTHHSQARILIELDRLPHMDAGLNALVEEQYRKDAYKAHDER